MRLEPSLGEVGGSRAAHNALTAGVALVAVAARLVPLLRGGGLAGLGNYDDGVYYAAGTALLHGLLPYRDYLLLHPPGIVLLLAPYGLAGLAGHDPYGLAAARISWILLGALNSVLVARILRPVGLMSAAAGSLFYATAYSAVYTEWTPLLEAPAQTCVLGALWLLTRPSPVVVRHRFAPVWAGALLGLSATFKIWGVASIAAVVLVYLAARRWGTATKIAAGAGAATTLVCLPFFVAAPSNMWQMVVIDQLGRPRSSVPLSTRLADIVSLGLHGSFASFDSGLLVVLGLVAALLVVSWTVPLARLCVLLSLSSAIVLLASPSWFQHYAGLAAGPLAVALGAGGGAVLRWCTRQSVWVGATAGLAAAVAIALGAAPLATARLGKTFPAGSFASTAAAAPCVTSDNPAALTAMNVLTSDLDHRCRFVADLGGYSYQFASERGAWVARAHDQQWQRLYLGYLRSGELTLPFQYAEHRALSPRTQAEIRLEPVSVASGGYALRSTRSASPR